MTKQKLDQMAQTAKQMKELAKLQQEIRKGNNTTAVDRVIELTTEMRTK